MVSIQDLQQEFSRELEHWKNAITRLADLDAAAPPQAWQALEHYLGVALRQSLTISVGRLRSRAQDFDVFLRTTPLDIPAQEFQTRLVDLRNAYLRVETAVDFYSDAVVMRSIPKVAALLRACDHIATRSMAEILTPMGRVVPQTLTFLDKGFGAAIIKAGLRIWDGSTENPCATIKITRHNLLRGAAGAILHESGHQVAFMLGWNTELAEALAKGLGSSTLGSLWSGFATEVAGDAFAHVHAGYAAAAALHDVLDSDDQTVFLMLPGDPHPPSYVRVLMALEMNRRSFGSASHRFAPWDRLSASWRAKHRIERCPTDIRPIFEESVRVLPRIVEIVLYTPYRAFGGRSLTQLIDPRRVSPTALVQLERDAGAAAFTSHYWAWNEAIRLMALNGFRAGLGPNELREAVTQQENWMLRLGSQSSLSAVA